MKDVQRETMNLLFFIKKTKLLRNGEAPICLRITMNKQIAEIRVKRSVSVNQWSQPKECAKGKDRIAGELNSYLNAIRLKIFQIQREIEEEGSPISVNVIVNRYYGKDQKTLLEVFKEHNDQCRELVGKDYVPGTIRKFDASLSYMKQYIQKKYQKDDVLLQEINQEFVRDYEFFLKTEKSTAKIIRH